MACARAEGFSGSPRIFDVDAARLDSRLVSEAAQIVISGGLVAFPTETVYGLAAHAHNKQTLERLNRVKGRPPEKPYSLHIYSASKVSEAVGSVPPIAQALIDRFWPGPLTIVLPDKNGATIGFRFPDHPVARAFLRACWVPVVASSANRSGDLPPNNAQVVLAALDGEIDGILNAGSTPLRRESTIVEVAGGELLLRREGAIAKEKILSVLQ